MVALSGSLYGFIGYFGTKLMHNDIPIVAMLFWRFFLASLWIMGTFFFQERPRTLPAQRFWLQLKTIASMIVAYTASTFLYFTAAQYIGTGTAMVIFFAFPVFVTIFAWCLTDWKMNMHALLSLLIVVMGLIFLKGWGMHSLNVAGVLIALGSAFSYATYVYTCQHSVRTIHSLWLSFYICFGNAAIFFIVALSTHQFAFPHALSIWMDALALGIIATALPVQLMLNGLKYISSIKASILTVLEPIVTVLIGLSLLHEPMTWIQMLGVIIVLLGALLIQFERGADQVMELH